MSFKYSVVVPVYNRPDEVRELLESLTRQSRKDFEIIIVEDGSTVSSEGVVKDFAGRLTINYYQKKNGGPGPARNFGFAKCQGEYFVIFDSDCIIPDDYFEIVDASLQQHRWDAWGGPDRPHKDFTILQQAMGYTMSSILTTGGIRGGKKRMGWFQPRSYNMGLSRRAFETTGGFRFDRFAEDIELSIRMRDAGLKVGLIADAFVYHKRRTTFGQFFRQVANFGKGRAMIGRVYPSEVKLTHWFPTVFLLSIATWCLTPLVSHNLFLTGAVFFGAYLMMIFTDALRVNKNFAVALLSVPSALLQLTGYGYGFLRERLKRT